MSEPRNFIEINGRKYDADTGQIIGSSATSVDGLVKKPKDSPKPEVLAQKLIKPIPTVDRAANHKARELEKSKTLMRPAVKKPKHEAPKVESEKKSEGENLKLNSTPQSRVKRAQETAKSSHISRFSPFGHTKVIKREADLPVAVKKPAAHHETPLEAVEHTVDLFEQAIQDATSHLEEYIEERTGRKTRKFAFAFASLAIIVICSFVIYQAVPAVKVKMASSKAGFSASLPSYSPAGYGLSGNIASNSGEVSLAYQSRTDNKGYKITQSPSEWNSQSLLNNFLVSENKDYQTYDNNGKTIYIYDGSNATWIDGGVWYKLEGNASLTSDQILRIASSL